MDAFFASAAEYFQGSGSGFVSVFCTVWRYLAPVLAVLLLWRTLGEYPRPREGLRHRRGLPDRFAHARCPDAL